MKKLLFALLLGALFSITTLSCSRTAYTGYEYVTKNGKTKIKKKSYKDRSKCVKKRDKLKRKQERRRSHTGY